MKEDTLNKKKLNYNLNGNDNYQYNRLLSTIWKSKFSSSYHLKKTLPIKSFSITHIFPIVNSFTPQMVGCKRFKEIQLQTRGMKREMHV